MGDLTPAGPVVSAELRAAVRDFRAAEGVLRHAAANDRERLERDRDVRVAALTEESAAAERRQHDEVTQQVERQDSRLRAAVAALIPHPPRGAADPLAAAEYVDLGAASLTTELPGRTGPVSTPAVAPLLDHGNLVVAGPWSEIVADLLRSVVYQALSGTGPGQLRIRAVDPEVRSALAVFSPLGAANDDLLSVPAGSDTEIEELLRGLVADLRSTMEMFQGRRTTLGRMRRETGQPIGTYQLLVVADYPARFTQRARSDLVTIMRQGPVNGISTLLHHEPVQVEPRLAELGQIITVDGSSAQASWLPGWTTRPRSERGLPEAVATLAEQSRGAEAPRIDFLACQPDLPLMSDSSAMRLVATIGRAGHQPVAVTLGDEVDQRHNILVSGAVGQGKSNLLMAIIHSLAMRYPPAELEMHLLDFKEGVTLEPLGAMSDASPSWLPHARSIGLNSDRAYGAAVLSHLVAEFERRAAIIRGHGDDITKYRLADPAHTMARILVVIDEFQVLFDSDDDITERALADLERLARKGRAYGIHLLLASQTLSGITPLLAKQDGIFAQFPVRLALKNSASESQAVLDQNNTEAARLRYRGELLLNLDFGAVEANRRATVAWAAEDQLRGLRRRMCDALGADLPVPAIFDGAHAPSLADSRAVLHALREAQRDRSRARQALLGTALDVGAPATGIPMTDDNGRHLAVVGAGASRAGTGAAGQNQAVGALQAAALSLALQHPEADAEIVVLDLLPTDLAAAGNLTGFVRALAAAGAAVEHLRGGDVSAYLSRLTEVVDARQAQHETTLYVVAFALDRARRLAELDLTSGAVSTPADGLRALLRDGPPVGAHLLAWWSSVRVMREQLGFDAADTIDGLLALRISAGDVQDLFGPFTVWKPEGPRGLLHDRTESADPHVIVPFRPLSAADIRTLGDEPWDS